jgi:hypothetical protein
MKTKTKTIILLIVFLLLAGFIYRRYFFVFGDGEKAGTMNYFVRKGYVFKTYEGKLIQNGIKTQTQQGSIGSNEFMFSVTSERVAQQLKDNAGAYLVLHYKEYLNSLAWRGVSTFVVDSVISVKPITP